MQKSLLITLLLLTFLLQESDLRVAPAMEVSTEVELLEVSEKYVSQYKIQFKRSVEKPPTLAGNSNNSYLILNEPIPSQLILPSIKKNILLMQFLI